jgi:hypothetical protein
MANAPDHLCGAQQSEADAGPDRADLGPREPSISPRMLENPPLKRIPSLHEQKPSSDAGSAGIASRRGSWRRGSIIDLFAAAGGPSADECAA